MDASRVRLNHTKPRQVNSGEIDYVSFYFIYLFVCLFVCLFVYLFIYFIHSFIHSDKPKELPVSHSSSFTSPLPQAVHALLPMQQHSQTGTVPPTTSSVSNISPAAMSQLIEYAGISQVVAELGRSDSATSVPSLQLSSAVLNTLSSIVSSNEAIGSATALNIGMLWNENLPSEDPSS